MPGLLFVTLLVYFWDLRQSSKRALSCLNCVVKPKPNNVPLACILDESPRGF
jgi:hypothetical protein